MGNNNSHGGGTKKKTKLLNYFPAGTTRGGFEFSVSFFTPCVSFASFASFISSQGAKYDHGRVKASPNGMSGGKSRTQSDGESASS